MILKANDLESALKSKGFQKDRQAQDRIYYFYHDGKKTRVHTKISHGRGEELGHPIVGKIKQQMYFDNPQQLREFVDCSFTKADYINLLKGKHIVEGN